MKIVYLTQIWSFVNSSFFIAFITLGVGLTAYYLYDKKKKDFKKNASKIILLEIQNAERLYRRAKTEFKKNSRPAETIFLMPTESWNKYKYLFIQNFDRDEWDTINSFYDNCRLYDKAVIYNNTFFMKNEDQIRINFHRLQFDYLDNMIKSKGENKISKDDIKILENKIDRMKGEYFNLSTFSTIYLPNKPNLDIEIHLEDISGNLSQTSIGTKLKNLCETKSKKEK